MLDTVQRLCQQILISTPDDNIITSPAFQLIAPPVGTEVSDEDRGKYAPPDTYFLN